MNGQNMEVAGYKIYIQKEDLFGKPLWPGPEMVIDGGMENTVWLRFNNKQEVKQLIEFLKDNFLDNE